MNPKNFKTEYEMMMALALIAVKVNESFMIDGSQYEMIDEQGCRQCYDLAYLDIRFVADNRQDCVVKFMPKTTLSEPLYCLLSELNTDEE